MTEQYGDMLCFSHGCCISPLGGILSIRGLEDVPRARIYDALSNEWVKYHFCVNYLLHKCTPHSSGIMCSGPEWAGEEQYWFKWQNGGNYTFFWDGPSVHRSETLRFFLGMLGSWYTTAWSKFATSCLNFTDTSEAEEMENCDMKKLEKLHSAQTCSKMKWVRRSKAHRGKLSPFDSESLDNELGTPHHPTPIKPSSRWRRNLVGEPYWCKSLSPEFLNLKWYDILLGVLSGVMWCYCHVLQVTGKIIPSGQGEKNM